MTRPLTLGLVLSFAALMPVGAPTYAQSTQMPRPLSEQDQARLQSRMAAGKVRRAQEEQEAERLRQEAAIQRAEEERLAELERQAQAEWEAAQPQQQASGGFAEALLHGMNAFQGEMTKAQVERAQQEAFLEGVRREAEGIAWQRERELERERRRVADEQARRAQAMQQQQQRAQQAGSAAGTQAGMQAGAGTTRSQEQAQVQAATQTQAETQAQARQQALREQAAAERKRQQQLREQTLATEQAAAERQRQADAAQQQALRQAEQSLRSGFRGRAATCVGGGKDVLYLQTSTPAKTGCRVTFEARCPGTPAGAGVHFSQANYIGGSCQGLGDNIRIGPMDCPAEQVQLSMTAAECG